jgi:hypothetical protein
MPDIQKLNFIAFRHSGLGNPHLVHSDQLDRLSDTMSTLIPLIAVALLLVFSSLLKVGK